MLLGKNEVIEWIGLNKTPFWSLQRTLNGEKIITKDEPDNFTVDESQEYLGRVLDMFEKGTYFIDAKKVKDANSKLHFKSSFRLGAVSGSTETAGIGDLGDIESRVMEKVKKEMEYERMKTENDELKREIDTINHQVSKRVAPYVPYMIEAAMEGIFGTKIKRAAAAQVAGIPPEDLEDQQERMEQAFKKWYESEKEVSPVVLVEKIVEMAEKDPEKYRMAKKLLMG